MQARVVLAVAIPGLCDVNLAVGRPGEGLLGKQPKGRPDTCRAGRLDDSGKGAAVTAKWLAAHQTTRSVALLWRGGRALRKGADHQEIVGCTDQFMSDGMLDEMYKGVLTGTRSVEERYNAATPGFPNHPGRCRASHPTLPLPPSTVKTAVSSMLCLPMAVAWRGSGWAADGYAAAADDTVAAGVATSPCPLVSPI